MCFVTDYRISLPCLFTFCRDDPSGATDIINQWASKHTKGAIQQIFNHPVPRSTAAVLTNSVYFVGEWEMPFDPKNTVLSTFKSSDTRTVNVQFMRGQFDLMYVHSKRCACRMVSVPYKHAKAAMYIILPENKTLYNIHEFAASLSADDIRELVSSTTLTSVTLVMPKMRLAHSFRIRRVFSLLQQQIEPEMQATVLGSIPEQSKKQNGAGLKCCDSSSSQNCQTLCKLRDQAAKPELMSGDRNSRVSVPQDNSFEIGDSIQQVFLEVNEMGTEAAAVGTTLVEYSGDIAIFIVDRPFIFFIKHEITDTLLFWGTIVDPTNDET
jgi:serpin B